MVIEYENKCLILEQMFKARSHDDEDCSIFLTFSSKEVKKLFNYYDLNFNEIDTLIHKLNNHYETYNSLKLFQDFFHNRGIYSTISEDVPLVNS
jgi:hypothetical protein